MLSYDDCPSSLRLKPPESTRRWLNSDSVALRDGAAEVGEQVPVERLGDRAVVILLRRQPLDRSAERHLLIEERRLERRVHLRRQHRVVRDVGGLARLVRHRRHVAEAARRRHRGEGVVLARLVDLPDRRVGAHDARGLEVRLERARHQRLQDVVDGAARRRRRQPRGVARGLDVGARRPQNRAPSRRSRCSAPRCSSRTPRRRCRSSA